MSSLAVPQNTRVPLGVPLIVTGIFAAAQLWLGTSPAIVAMCVGTVIIPFMQLHFFGRDLYAVLGLGFSLRYAGIALAAKTFYGQTLESNLYDPYAAFGLTLLLMCAVTAMLIVARALDRGKVMFPLPMDLVSLRRLSVICICLGLAGYFAYSTGAFNTAAAPGGAMVVLGAALREYYYLGLIAEAIYAIKKSGGRSVVTPRLIFLFFVQAFVATSLNGRELLVTCVISIATVAFLYDVLRLRHIIIGIVAGMFFINIFTPITIYLRINKTGLSLTEFAELAGNTIVKAATEPDFFKLVSDTQKDFFYQDPKAWVPYDYYGIRSEVLDRLSFVSLVDAVDNGTKTHEPLGMASIEQSLARVAPSFLGYNKELTTTGPGDWLSWQTGLEEPGRVSFTVFGLPMEGLASWGLTGMIVYPFIFMLPVLYVCGRLSSLRLPLPVSIFLFAGTQHMMLESTSDEFLGWMTRSLPLIILSLFALNYTLRPRARLRRVRAV